MEKTTRITDAKKRRNDVILIVSLLLSLSLIGALLLLFSKEGDTVIVTVDGAVFGEYPLCEDRVVEIRTNSTLNILDSGRPRTYP